MHFNSQRCERLRASVVDIIKGNIRIEDEKLEKGKVMLGSFGLLMGWTDASFLLD